MIHIKHRETTREGVFEAWSELEEVYAGMGVYAMG